MCMPSEQQLSGFWGEVETLRAMRDTVRTCILREAESPEVMTKQIAAVNARFEFEATLLRVEWGLP